MITSIDQLDPNGHYTYADYLTWNFEEYVELIKGRIMRMSAPNVRHQRISTNLHGEIWQFLRHKPCDVFSAPFDVRLPLPKNKMKNNKVDTVVQPDLCVICDRMKLDEQGCIGAPDLVVEILSPANSKKEMKDKLELYEESGVKEYWVVDTIHNFVLVYVLGANNKYQANLPLTDEDVIESNALVGLKIGLKGVFEE